SRFVALQAPYSLADRAPERDLLPMARAFDMAVAPWGLLEAGELTGKYNRESAEPKRNRKADERNMALAETVMALAHEIGRTPSQVAINWVRQQSHPGRAPIIPILGARTEAHIRDNLGCLDFELTPEQLRRLSDASPISLGFPHSFLHSNHVRQLIFGNTYELLDNHRG
ncbi:MAG: aldo/keto reductase, partial [Anaerolineales bacterium]